MAEKIAMITDLHFGIRKGSDEFLQSQMRFMKDQFIPEIRSRGIKILVFGGDLFEYRTHLNIKIGNAVFDLFKEDLKDFQCYVLAGNHDIYYNNTTSVNSIRHLGLLPHVHIIETITPLQVDGTKILLVPWQTSNTNFIDFMSKNTEVYDVCLCHYAIHGFLFSKGKVNVEEGIAPDIFFNNFKLVISGHFHKRNAQKRNNSTILYMGSPWHLSRIDIGENKGGLVLDVGTLDYEFIDNTTSIRFCSLKYPETLKNADIAGNIVDVYVEYTKDFDDDDVHAYIQAIEKLNPVFPPNVKIVNNFVNTEISTSGFKTTTELINDYINAQEIGNKDEIHSLMIELYNEAKGDS